jgi:hypothetical protein
MIKSLLELNVQDHVEKKNGLTYLSWAWAWAEALKADPTATFHVDTFQRADGTTVPYMDINGTAMVWVRTTLFGKEMTCFLPVMDHRNKPIQNPDSFQVNTAIMRCMTKCLALHGLGLYIYAGEDLPEQEGKPEPEKKPAPKAEAKVPAKAEGEPGRWQITIKAKPDATPTDWVNLISEAAVVCLEQAESQADTMKIYQTNRALFDKLKTLDAGCHKDLLEAFKTKKDSFQ